MGGFVKRLVLLPFVALLLTVSMFTAPRAFADGKIGPHQYTFNHCAGFAWTKMYEHSWCIDICGTMDGRVDVNNCSPPGNMRSISRYRLTMWRSRCGGGPGGCWVAVAESNWECGGTHYCTATVPVGRSEPFDTTPDVNCSNTGAVQPGDVVHTEYKYRVNWDDGSQTDIRQDNSDDVTITSGNCD